MELTPRVWKPLQALVGSEPVWIKQQGIRIPLVLDWSVETALCPCAVLRPAGGGWVPREEDFAGRATRAERIERWHQQVGCDLLACGWEVRFLIHTLAALQTSLPWVHRDPKAVWFEWETLAGVWEHLALQIRCPGHGSLVARASDGHPQSNLFNHFAPVDRGFPAKVPTYPPPHVQGEGWRLLFENQEEIALCQVRFLEG